MFDKHTWCLAVLASDLITQPVCVVMPENKAKGIVYKDGTILMKAGAEVHESRNSSFQNTNIYSLYDSIRTSNSNLQNDKCVLNADCRCLSVTYAASILKGQLLSGWDAWFVEDYSLAEYLWRLVKANKEKYGGLYETHPKG